MKTQIKDGESLRTAVEIWETANWLEREVYDMFGITFDGHPDLKRILLPDGWKGYPLRKDYPILLAGPGVGADQPRHREWTMSDTSDRTAYLDLDTKDETFLDSTELVLNMGPQHPSTHGVLRVILKLDGEKVLGTECVIGYLHRGVEKIGENRTYTMFNPYVDRMDYVAAVSNGLGYCEAVEKLLNVEAPPRAQYIRVILTELCRIASHQVWLGTHALDIGALTPLFYCFRDREEILKIFEKYCGARLTTHAFRIGGCIYEAYDGFEQDCNKFCDFFLPKLDEYEALLTTNRIWVERTKGVGILNPEDCIALGVTGPVLRASGVKWDLRKAQPYEAYKNFDFEIPTGLNGDTYDRYLVRIQEMRQAVRIIRQAVEGLPQGRSWPRCPR